jgi:hypothetical protein
MKNKISTLSYFIKRLKDNKYTVWKIFDAYNIGDPRKWTIMVNPGYHSVYITCKINNESLKNEAYYKFDDGNSFLTDNISIQTQSMQVIINKLIECGITPNVE